MRKIADVLLALGMLALLAGVSPAVAPARASGMAAAGVATPDNPASAHDRRSHRAGHARHRRHHHHSHH